MSDYGISVIYMMDKARREFDSINRDSNLTEADKRQLKDFYLQNLVAPEARRILEEELAREKAREERIRAREALRHRGRP